MRLDEQGEPMDMRNYNRFYEMLEELDSELLVKYPRLHRIYSGEIKKAYILPIDTKIDLITAIMDISTLVIFLNAMMYKASLSPVKPMYV